jgi:hypothetical protein
VIVTYAGNFDVIQLESVIHGFDDFSGTIRTFDIHMSHLFLEKGEVVVHAEQEADVNELQHTMQGVLQLSISEEVEGMAPFPDCCKIAIAESLAQVKEQSLV